MPEFAENVTPNVVPASFVPDPGKFKSEITQELRNIQSRLAQGYSMAQISYVENQRHLSPYKRAATWQSASEVEMGEAIKVLKTARTVMMNEISKWAGSLNEKELEAALPVIWGDYVQQVNASMHPVNVTEEIPASAEVVPIQVINRPEIPEDAPRSKVTPPEQLTLGDVLTQIEKKNS